MPVSGMGIPQDAMSLLYINIPPHTMPSDSTTSPVPRVSRWTEKALKNVQRLLAGLIILINRRRAE